MRDPDIKQRLASLCRLAFFAYLGITGLAGLLLLVGPGTAGLSTPGPTPDTVVPQIAPTNAVDSEGSETNQDDQVNLPMGGGDAMVDGVVRNVFGDRVPGATVSLAGISIDTSESAAFVFEPLRVGSYDLHVQAPGYRPLSLNLHVQKGTNSPSIKYDTGLWPTGFLADFHVFFPPENTFPQAVYGTYGLANGAEQQVVIARAVIVDPSGRVVRELLAYPEDFRAFAATYGPGMLIERPRPGIVLAPQSVVRAEFTPIPGTPQIGPYSLRIRYGTRAEHEQGAHRLLVLSDVPHPDDDWNPHTP